MAAKEKTPAQLEKEKEAAVKKALKEAVFTVKDKDVPEDQAALVGTYACLCPLPSGCGSVDPETGEARPFFSPGWPSEEIARDRLEEHFRDHLGEPSTDLHTFRAKHGLQQADDGLRAVFTAKDFVS